MRGMFVKLSNVVQSENECSGQLNSSVMAAASVLFSQRHLIHTGQ